MSDLVVEARLTVRACLALEYSRAKHAQGMNASLSSQEFGTYLRLFGLSQPR